MRSLHVFSLILLVSVSAFSVGLQNTYFDKKIDLDDWTQKMKMPLAELVQAVQKNVNLYSFRQANQVYASVDPSIRALPLAPTDLYNNNRRDIELGGAVGIYMPVEQLRHLISQPTLLVREDAKHWTLIHEYTHHLFYEARRAQNLNLPEYYLTTFTDHFETLEESYKRYQKNGNQFKDQAHLDEFILCLKVVADLRIKMILQFELEEITIETMISQYHRQIKSKNFDPDYAENSKRYIQSNFKRVVGVLNNLILLIDVGLPYLNKDSADHHQLSGYRVKIATLKHQVQKFR